MDPHKNNSLKTTTFLNSISPISTSRKDILVAAIAEFVFIFLVVFILKPYVIKELSESSVLQVALIAAFIFSFFSWVYYANYNVIDLRKWTYKKDIIRYLKVLTFTATIFMSYAYYALHFIYTSEITVVVNNFIITGFLYILFLGLIFYFFAKFIDYVRFSKNTNLNLVNEEKVIDKISIIFYGKNNNEFVKTKLTNIIYIQSVGHYIQFYLKSKNEVKVKIIRNSFSSIIKKADNYNSLFQCHRSYIVNLNMITKIEGNSQKAVLILNNDEINKIPISRENYKNLKKSYSFGENLKAIKENNYLEVV